MSKKPNKSRENSAAAERLADWRGADNYMGQGTLSIADSDSPEYDPRGAFGQDTDEDVDGGVDTMSLKDGDREKEGGIDTMSLKEGDRDKVLKNLIILSVV